MNDKLLEFLLSKRTELNKFQLQLEQCDPDNPMAIQKLQLLIAYHKADIKFLEGFQEVDPIIEDGKVELTDDQIMNAVAPPKEEE